MNNHRKLTDILQIVGEDQAYSAEEIKKLRRAIEDVYDTIEMNTMKEIGGSISMKGSYRLINNTEIEQLLMRLRCLIEN